MLKFIEIYADIALLLSNKKSYFCVYKFKEDNGDL